MMYRGALRGYDHFTGMAAAPPLSQSGIFGTAHSILPRCRPVYALCIAHLNFHQCSRRGKMNCQQCAAANDDMTAQHCTVCGHALAKETGTVATIVKTRSGVSCPGKTRTQRVSFYKAMIGEKSQSYYLLHFNARDRRQSGLIGWNWAAFLGGIFWLPYRKMWLYAGLAFASIPLTYYAVWVAGAAAGWSAGTISAVQMTVYLACYCIVLPVVANALYHRHCLALFKRARANSPKPRQTVLVTQGGTSWIAPVLFAMTIIPLQAITLFNSLPGIRERNAREGVAAGFSLGTQATVAVSAYHNANSDFPDSVEEAGFTTSLIPWVRRIDIDGRNGALLVHMSSGPLRGKTLTFTPHPGAQGRLSWTCWSDDIPGNILPPACQGRSPGGRMRLRPAPRSAVTSVRGIDISISNNFLTRRRAKWKRVKRANG
jgi:hypothetical protein